MPGDGTPDLDAATRGLTFYSLAEAAVDPMVLVDGADRVVWANAAFLSLFGGDMDSFIGKTLEECLTSAAEPGAVHRVLADIAASTGATATAVLHLATEANGERIMEVTAVHIATDGGALHMIAFRDVTEATRTREALAESEERFALAMKSSGNALWDWDLSSNALYLSPAWKAQLGYGDHELENSFDTFAMLLHEADRDETLAAVQAWIEAPTGMWLRRFRLRHKDGGWRWIQARGAPVVDDDGTVRRLLGTHIDLTDQMESEVRLRESEERYRSLIENLREGFGMLDADGRFTFVNDSLCQMIGRRADEMIGEPGRAFLTQAGCRTLDDQLEHRRIGGISPYELEWEHADGTPVHTIISPRPLMQDGENVGSFATVTDVSELKAVQRQLEESKTFVDTVLNTIPEIVSIFSLAEERNTFTNDGVHTALGWSPEEIRRMGTNLFPAILHPDDMESVINHHRRLASAEDDEVLHLEYRLQAASGEWRTFRGSDRVFARDEQGVVLSIVGAAMDITSERQAQAELERASENLARSNRELEQFAYIASHDLQEPLRMVTSYLQLLERRYRDALDDDARDFIDFAVDGAKRMKALIQALLEYSRVDTRTEELVDTDLNQVVREVLGDLRLTIRDLEATVTATDLPTLRVDRHQMSRAFANLIGNALKFHADRPPEVEVRAEQTGNGWVVSVSDNGIGIAPDHRERVFDIFQRLHTREEYPGTGIGLSIVRRIMDRHGGPPVAGIRTRRGQYVLHALSGLRMVTGQRLTPDRCPPPSRPPCGTARERSRCRQPARRRNPRPRWRPGGCPPPRWRWPAGVAR
jgi:PAS domain S-box-containing protein